NLSSILSENVTSLQAALDLENQLRQVRYHSFHYLLKPTRAGLEQIDSDEAALREAMARARAAARGPQEHVILHEIESGFQQYQDEMARLRADVARTGPRRDFLDLAETHPVRHVVAPCQKLKRLNREQLERTAE